MKRARSYFGLTLAALALSDSSVPLLVSTALFGLTIGNLLMMQSLLVADRFGVRDFPRISARQGLIAFTGTAGGPFLLGWLHDAAGGYRAAYLAAGACSLVATTLFVFAQGDSRSTPD